MISIIFYFAHEAAFAGARRQTFLDPWQQSHDGNHWIPKVGTTTLSTNCPNYKRLNGFKVCLHKLPSSPAAANTQYPAAVIPLPITNGMPQITQYHQTFSYKSSRPSSPSKTPTIRNQGAPSFHILRNPSSLRGRSSRRFKIQHQRYLESTPFSRSRIAKASALVHGDIRCLRCL